MKELIKYPNSTLKNKSNDVVLFDAELSDLVDHMIESMYVERGVGLAAPQLGVNKNVVVLDHTSGEVDNNLYVLVNPMFKFLSPTMISSKEGCLSLPGISLNVKRHQSCVVEFFDKLGNRRVQAFDDFSSCIVQHEIDHLNGVLIIDKVSSYERKLLGVTK